MIDLLALYKLNVLHLHLTDDQAWRLPAGGQPRDGAFYTAADLRALVGYAADRFVTIVPEVDTPGHASALMRMHPELNSGRNGLDRTSPPGQEQHAVWLDPELPATFTVMEEVLAAPPRSAGAEDGTAPDDVVGQRPDLVDPDGHHVAVGQAERQLGDQ